MQGTDPLLAFVNWKPESNSKRIKDLILLSYKQWSKYELSTMLQILSAAFSKCPGTEEMKASRIGEAVSGAACRARLNCTVRAALAHPHAQFQKEKVSICYLQH